MSFCELNDAHELCDLTYLVSLLSQRTWEDPTFFHPDADGCRGDNDPVDVCEIGMRIVMPGVSNSWLFSYFYFYLTVSHTFNTCMPLVALCRRSVQSRFLASFV